MKIVDLMINLLDGLYDLNDKTKEQLHNNAEEIERAFDGYMWDDIRRAINYYYVRKNDKTRPTIAKILAILETDPNTQKFVTMGYDEPKRPETKIFAIKTTFDRLVNILSECRILNFDEPSQESCFLVNDDGEPILDVKNALRDQIECAKLQNIELFQRHGAITWLEALAICIDNDLFHLKIRNNKKFLDRLPQEGRIHVRNRNSEELKKFLKKWQGTKIEGIYTI